MRDVLKSNVRNDRYISSLPPVYAITYDSALSRYKVRRYTFTGKFVDREHTVPLVYEKIGDIYYLRALDRCFSYNIVYTAYSANKADLICDALNERETKYAEWEDCDGDGRTFICNACGCTAPYTYWHSQSLTQYCPSCGRKMGDKVL